MTFKPNDLREEEEVEEQLHARGLVRIQELKGVEKIRKVSNQGFKSL